MNKMYYFEKDNKKFTNKYKCNPTHPDGELHLYKIFLNEDEITKKDSLVEWYKKNDKHFHLGYIALKEKYQHKGLLKNYIHPHCIEFMKSKGIEIITLKPLANAFIVWVSLGFKVKRKTEEIEIKRLIEKYLLEKDVKIDKNFAKMELNEIVNKYKKYLKSNDFPPKLKKVFYTNFQKVLK